MEYVETTDNDILTFNLNGSLSFDDFETMKNITLNLPNIINDNIVIDMTSLNFIDSSGIGMILIFIRKAFDSGKQIYVKNFHGQVERIVMLTKLTDLFNNPSLI